MIVPHRQVLTFDQMNDIEVEQIAMAIKTLCKIFEDEMGNESSTVYFREYSPLSEDNGIIFINYGFLKYK